MLNTLRYTRGEARIAQHRRCKDGISGRQARSNDKRSDGVQSQNDSDHTGADEPAEGHDGPQHPCDGFPVPGEVIRRKFQADYEDLQSKDETGKFLDEGVFGGRGWGARVDGIEHVGSHDDAGKQGERRLGEV